MKPYRLVDLYVPTTCASVDEALDAARARGLAAIVYVASDPEHLPTAAALSPLQDGSDVDLHPAYEVTGCGYRILALLPAWDDVASYAALEEIDDPDTVTAQIHAAGGAAIIVCPHAHIDGSPRRDAPALNGDLVRPGVLCLVSQGRRLVRDLDCEHTSAHGRRVLGGTGPFGGLEDLGRFSTLFSRYATTRLALIASLRAGHGTTVEMGCPPAGETESPGPPKRKRRRRRRGKRTKPPNDGASEGETPTE